MHRFGRTPRRRAISRIASAIAVACAFASICAGCARSKRPDAIAVSPPTLPATNPALYALLADPEYSAELQALIVPPIGWQPSILPAKFNAFHQLWISPSGRTAYGVIKFSLPLPLPHDPVLWAFMKEMRKKEGQADLLHKGWDPRRRGLRAVIEGGRFTIRTTITLRGLSGWITYAGTLRNEPIEPGELETAEAARDRTELGKKRD
jgi:hypothetical protein